MRLRISPTTGLSFSLMQQPSAAQSAAPNIRQTDELVNEMGIQFCVGDMAAILSRYGAATKLLEPSPLALIQGMYGGRLRTVGKRRAGGQC
jgi:hypothetical protein